MMKSASLKPFTIGLRLGKAVFPKCHPAFNRNLKIARRTEQVQMVRHQKKITDKPSGGCPQPNVMQGTLD
jgi:hypothetical protein